MKARFIIGIILILVESVLPNALIADEVSFVSFVDGKEYKTRITVGQLKLSPSWRVEDQNPPLAARSAVLSASKLLAQLVGNPEEWKANLICLRSPANDEKWIYVVQFAGRPKIRWRESSNLQTLTLAVLMNGETLKPAVTDLASDSPGPGEFEASCDIYDRLGSTLNRQQRVPGTNFVNYLVEEASGNGMAPRPGSLVELRYEASVINQGHFPPVKDKLLKFHLGRGEVGKGIEAAVLGMEVGGKRTVLLREEVAEGIRENWKNLPRESQLRVQLEMVRSSESSR